MPSLIATLSASLDALEEACDGLSIGSFEETDAATSADAYAKVAVRLHKVEAQLASARLRIVAAADRARVHRESGATNTGAWLAGVTREDGARASRDVRLARQLDQSCSRTGDALARGEISAGHAEVITQTMSRAARKLPDHLGEDQRTRVEEHLLDQATRLTPDQLRRRARRAIEAIEPDPGVVDAEHERQLHAEEADGYAAARLTLHQNTDGTTTGRFTVPALHGALLRKLLDALTTPRRAHLGAPEAQHGNPTFDDPERDAKRKGAALCEILEHLPVDRLSRGGANLLITLDLDKLQGALGAAGLETGQDISAAEARRLACNAGLIPTVLGRQSQPLDLGRQSRLFTDAQRAALSLKHRSCAAAGCDRPYAWTEIHHRDAWARGGSTDLSNAIPLCWFHHRRIHDPAYHYREGPDGIAFTRRQDDHGRRRPQARAGEQGTGMTGAGVSRHVSQSISPLASVGSGRMRP